MQSCINIVNTTALVDCPPCDKAFPFALGLIIGLWIGLMITLILFKHYISEQNEIIE